MNRRKEEHTCDGHTGKRLRKHILESMERVLTRPRFGISAEMLKYDGGIIFSHAEYKYLLQVSVLEIVVIIEVMGHSDDLFHELVFTETFPVRQIPKINKIGTTIANKIRNRTIMNIMAE